MIALPGSVRKILNSLHEAGFEAYAVGGCVRDSILGRTPQDWDVTTSARPEEVKKIFPRCIDTGIEHGTVTVLSGGRPYEVTTYRIDGSYKDARHPESVTYTSSLAEDLKRRDFTINAMAYNEEEGLADLVGGLADLEKRVIRCVGDPMERFSEDALRILRAVRFSAQLDFSIDPETLEGVKKLAPNLSLISAERICSELLKLITSGHPEYLRTAYEAGVTKVILPEFDRMMETPQNTPYHFCSVGEHTILSMQNVPADPKLRLTMLLHDIAKPSCRTTDENGEDHFKGHGPKGAVMAEEICRRLKLDNDTVRTVQKLVLYHDWWAVPEPKAVRRMVHTVGEELIGRLFQVQMADTLAKSACGQEESLERIRHVEALYEQIRQEGQCLSLKDLAISGKDLLELGIPKGPEIGRLLKAAMDAVLEDPAANEKGRLLELITRLHDAGEAAGKPPGRARKSL